MASPSDPSFSIVLLPDIFCYRPEALDSKHTDTYVCCDAKTVAIKTKRIALGPAEVNPYHTTMLPSSYALAVSLDRP
jgi:hypothetical protein